MQIRSIGVRELLSIEYGPKDITYELGSMVRLQEGVRGHKEATALRPEDYLKEVQVSGSYQWRNWTLTVKGRVDGLKIKGNEIIVEEIKTTWLEPGQLAQVENDFYRGQLLLYCWFVSRMYPLCSVRGVLVWWCLDGHGEVRCPLEGDVVSQGKDLFIRLARTWLAREVRQERWLAKRNQSLTSLAFPFPSYRPGQHRLQAAVEEAINHGQDLLAEASTGIGKTAATLHPALVWLSEAPREAKLFFLTAKTSGRLIVRETLERWPNLRLRTVFIEAKDRSCQREDRDCNQCPLAVNFYPRAARLLPGLLSLGLITEKMILETALSHDLCPFELGLEAASLADLVVGDYNYVFDPLVQLKRFFGQGTTIPSLLLIDEAHNLVDRGRDMFSSTLCKKQTLDLSREYKGLPLGNHAKELNTFFIQWNKEMKAAGSRLLEPDKLPRGLLSLCEKLQETLDHLAGAGQLTETASDYARRLRRFLKIYQMSGSDHAMYVSSGQGDTFLNLQCLNPGPLLSRQRGKSLAVCFSATLSPAEYYRELLGLGECRFLSLPSPFPAENRLYLHVTGVQTRYSVRERYYPTVASLIGEITRQKAGNYLAFFPSYAYLEQVGDCLDSSLPPEIALHRQKPGMNTTEREQFLTNATGSGHNLGLAVLGGLFGEGIDLPGDKLIGAFIVGPGLPQVSPRQEFIRRYFEQHEKDGFLFAYLVPGMLRVVQSAGRVVRSAEDQGIIVLLDDRFRERSYRSLLPAQWLEEGLFLPDWSKRLGQFWQK